MQQSLLENMCHVTVDIQLHELMKCNQSIVVESIYGLWENNSKKKL